MPQLTCEQRLFIVNNIMQEIRIVLSCNYCTNNNVRRIFLRIVEVTIKKLQQKHTLRSCNKNASGRPATTWTEENIYQVLDYFVANKNTLSGNVAMICQFPVLLRRELLEKSQVKALCCAENC